ncbi:MAG TPA: DUF3999 domain-containing protein [Usitatibacter sp.]|nr:DUF3999 domain-containing protein [Usitatibacter sp.]
MKTNLCQAQIPLNLCLAQILCAATLAAAQSPSDFRSSAPVAAARGDALQRLTLPFEVYRDARPDLADIRIFNAAGEAMPMAYAADPEPTRQEPASASLAMFPIFGAPRAEKGDVGNVELTVQSYKDGTIVSLKTKNAAPAKDQRPIAWILDGSAIKQPMRNLDVDWNTGKGLEIARITVDGSDDLKSWSPIAMRSPVMAVVQGSERLVQRKVDLRGARYKYLRVSADPPAFQLVHARVESDAVWTPAPRLTRSAAGAAGAKAGEYMFDLGARLPVESVNLKLSEVNSVAPFRLLARDDPAKEGRGVASATFYRLFREGFELESPPVNVGRVSARYWIARLDPRSPPPGGGPPTLEAQYRPAQVVFVARGDGPFTLAFGNPEMQSSVLAVSQLIPGYERLAELKLQEAKVGAVATGEIKGDFLRSITGGTSPRKLALWAVLIVAVIALGIMAFRLAKQVNAPGP